MNAGVGLRVFLSFSSFCAHREFSGTATPRKPRSPRFISLNHLQTPLGIESIAQLENPPSSNSPAKLFSTAATAVSVSNNTKKTGTTQAKYPLLEREIHPWQTPLLVSVLR